MVELTGGSLERMLRNEKVEGAVVQVTGIKRIETSQQGIPRYRLTLNDGLHTTSSALLSTQKNDAATDGELTPYCVVKVVLFVCNTVQNRRLIMLVDFNVIRRGDDVQHELGSPMPLEAASANDASNGNSFGAPAVQNRQPLNVQQPMPVSPPPILRDQQPAVVQKTVAVAFQHQPVKNGAGANPPPNVFPLHSITPYQNKWCVRVRVTKKYPIKTYRNSQREGKLFSVDLADESGEMRATGFNQECEKFYDWLKEGAVYYIRGGQIKTANRQYTSINNDYELTFSGETHIEPCYDDSSFQLPAVTFNFAKLDKLSTDMKDRVIDVIGVVDSCGPCQTIVSRKTNQELKKRDVRIVDDSLTSVSLTLWGAEAEAFEHEGHPVLAIKGVRVSDFNGVSLSTTANSQQHLNPDVPEAHRLRGWYDSQGQGAAPIRNLSSAGGPGGAGAGGSYIPIAMAEADRLGSGDKPDYYRVKAFISNVRRDNCLYKACPGEECNKKVIDQGTGRYRCERCNKEYDTFKWRLMLQVTINDFSGTQPITVFNQQAEQLIGMQSQDLQDLRDRNEEDFNITMDKLLFKQYSFRLRAKMDLYNDELRLKVMCQQVDEVSVTDYCKFLTEEIKKMEAFPDSM